MLTHFMMRAMNWTGKIICMILGFFLVGNFGLIIGFFIGHLVFDQDWFRKWLHSSTHSYRQRVQEVFFNTTFRVMGFLAKSDGRVSENEIYQARQVMQKMSLNNNMKREAILLFTEGKRSDFNLDMVISQLRHACVFQPALLRIFLEIQIQVTYADAKTINERKRCILQYISQQLGIAGFHFEQFEWRYRTKQNNQNYQTYNTRVDPDSQLLEAYDVLSVAGTASMLEIKKAYRRLLNQHHPDKLMAKDLPPEMIKAATQKTQQIKNAYEKIRKARRVS